MAARYIPKPYKCATAEEVEYALSRAAEKRIKQLGLTAAELKRPYPSIRLDHIRRLDNDGTLGYRMSCAILEATGHPVQVIA